MPKDVVLWPDLSLDFLQEIIAAGPVAPLTQIPMTQRGPMSYEDVNSRWNLLPNLTPQERERANKVDNGSWKRKSKKVKVLHHGKASPLEG